MFPDKELDVVYRREKFRQNRGLVIAVRFEFWKKLFIFSQRDPKHLSEVARRRFFQHRKLIVAH